MWQFDHEFDRMLTIRLFAFYTINNFFPLYYAIFVTGNYEAVRNLLGAQLFVRIIVSWGIAVLRGYVLNASRMCCV